MSVCSAMKVIRQITNSVEYGHLSDTIGHARANFNGGECESIDISVFYMPMVKGLQDNAIENIWLWPLGK